MQDKVIVEIAVFCYTRLTLRVSKIQCMKIIVTDNDNDEV